MKYSERDELVSGLRALADFIEERGIELKMPYSGISFSEGVSVWKYETEEEKETKIKAELQRIARVLGSCEKKYSDYDFKLIKRFGPHVKMQFYSIREAVCEKKQVGTKMVDVTEYKVVGQKEEPVYEIFCKPLFED